MGRPEKSDYEEIRELKYEYCYCLDYGRVDDFVELFAPDGHFVVGSADTEATGSEELRAMAERINGFDVSCLSHMAFNPVIDIDGDSATGKWFSIIILASNDGRVEWGHSRYFDEYVRIDGEWKFQYTRVERRHTVDLSGMSIEAGAASPLGSLE